MSTNGKRAARYLGVIAASAIVLMSASIAHASVIVYLTQPSFLSAAGSVTLLETFEGVLPKDTPLPSFVSSGVTYTGLAGTPFPNVWVASPGYNNFGAGVGLTTTSILTANGDEDFDIAFSSPYQAIGFDGYLNGLGPVTIEVFDASGLILTYLDLRNLDTKEFFGFISDTPITALRWTTTLGGQLNTGIDNILVAASVPEPSVLALVAVCLLSLFGFGITRRRADT